MQKMAHRIMHWKSPSVTKSWSYFKCTAMTEFWTVLPPSKLLLLRTRRILERYVILHFIVNVFNLSTLKQYICLYMHKRPCLIQTKLCTENFQTLYTFLKVWVWIWRSQFPNNIFWHHKVWKYSKLLNEWICGR